MKLYLSFFTFIVFTLASFAQIDSENKSISIPAVETEKDSADVSPILPNNPINNNQSINELNTPKVSSSLNLPKKEFSMFPEEKFGNPGEQYKKRLDEFSNEIKSELHLGTIGSKTDQYFGDFITKSKYVRVLYRDYGAEDGDLVRVSVNNEIIEYRVLLTNSFKGFKIDLKEGSNVIDFLALTEGYALPNTAHFRVVDDQNNVIASDLWALSIDVKGSINIIKE